MTTPVLRPLSLGEVLDTSFGLYRVLFVPLIIITVVCRVIPTVLGIFLTTSGGVFAHPVAWLIQLLVSLVTTAFGVAAVTFVVAAHYLDRNITAGDALGRAAALVVPVMILALFRSVVVGVGFILLIVPGVILAAGLALSTVAMVLEHLGPTAAMDRSWKLSKGYRGKIMLTLFVASLLFIIPLMIVAVVGGVAAVASAGAMPPVVTQIVTAVLGVFIFPYLYIIATVLYYDMRVRKEGFDLELLAAAAPAA